MQAAFGVPGANGIWAGVGWQLEAAVQRLHWDTPGSHREPVGSQQKKRLQWLQTQCEQLPCDLVPSVGYQMKQLSNYSLPIKTQKSVISVRT